jgi:hypothetical protein
MESDNGVDLHTHTHIYAHMYTGASILHEA